MENLGVIIVLYNPDIVTVQRNLALLTKEHFVVMVNNGGFIKQLSGIHNSVLLQLDRNEGIAYAINQGLQYFLERHFSYVITFDQDSLVTDNLVENLLSDYLIMNEKEHNVAAVAPLHINMQDLKAYRFSLLYNNPKGWEVRELMTSGMLINMSYLEQVGLMDEKLFIDGVDSEWCWRARANGLKLFISNKIHMYHKLGEGDRTFLWKKVAIPTPFRTYYQFRNYFILLRRNYVPVSWKIINGIKYLIKLFYYPICVSPRKQYLKRMLRGVYDGVLGRI